jgi:polar amino acid transport system substrate-binding protein
MPLRLPHVRVSRRGFLSAASALGAAALTGCTTKQSGVPVPVTTPRAKSVSLGVFDYRPYAFTDRTGQITGEVVEVVRAICETLGRKLTVQKLPYEAILPQMDARGIDVVGGLSIRARNCASLDFTVPDHVSLTALAVPKGNPKGITTFIEVVSMGARLAVVANSLDVTTADEAGVTGIQTYPTSDEMLRAVTEGKADCAAYDDITLRDLLTRTPGLELRPPFEPVGGSPRYGFGFRKGDALRDDFDKVITSLHDSGEWLRIAAQFGFTESNIPNTDRVSDKACER